MNETVYRPFHLFGKDRAVPNQTIIRKVFIADDHFLISEKLGCNEDYVRVAFKDIRCVMVKNTQMKVTQLILGIIMLVLVRIVGIVMIARYFRRLNSCACYLVTDTQTIRIPVPFSYKKMPGFVQFLSQQNVSSFDNTSFSSPRT